MALLVLVTVLLMASMVAACLETRGMGKTCARSPRVMIVTIRKTCIITIQILRAWDVKYEGVFELRELECFWGGTKGGITMYIYKFIPFTEREEAEGLWTAYLIFVVLTPLQKKDVELLLRQLWQWVRPWPGLEFESLDQLAELWIDSYIPQQGNTMSPKQTSKTWRLLAWGSGYTNEG